MNPLFWIASSRKDLKAFPAEVQDEMGYALRARRAPRTLETGT